jgi:hypothetical protein
MLSNKSLIELRGIAQSLSIPDIFQKDKTQLLQAISLKQQALIPEPRLEIPKPEYDARLMTLPPARRSERSQVEQLLAPFVAKGMHLSFDEERWYMQHGKKTDEGTMRMPLKTVLHCANKIMQ